MASSSLSGPLPPVLLEDSVNLLAGAPGVGKTAFLAWWIKRLQATHGVFGLTPPTPIPYQAWISADRSWARSTRLWFEAEGIGHFPHYSLQDDTAFKKSRLRRRQDRISIFCECLEPLSPTGDGQFPPGSLIYVDPLALFLGGNLLDYDSCLVACSELREICQDRHVTLLGTAHSAKQKADVKERYLRLQDRILGSAALFGYTDTQLYLASPEEMGTPHYTFLWAPHHAKAQTFALTRDDEGRFLPKGEISGGRFDEHPTSLSWLREVLPARDTWPLSELVTHGEPVGHSRRSIYRGLKVGIIEGWVIRIGTALYRHIKPS